MRPDQAFRFVALIAAYRTEAQRSTMRCLEVEAAEALVLHRFLEAFPKAPTLHQRLSMPPHSQRLAAFVSWLRDTSLAGEGIHQHPHGSLWAYARLWRALNDSRQPIAPEPQPEPPPAPIDISATTARAALARLIDRPFRTSTRRELCSTLDAVVTAWEREIHLNTEDTVCHDCEQEWVFELFTAQHLRACAGHPALVRLDIARRTAQLMGLPPPPRIELPVPAPAPSRVDLYAARRELEQSQPGPNLEALVTEWARAKDRSLDPCPWCRAVLPLEAMLPHLRACERHPAREASLHAEVPLDPALHALVDQHARLERGLRLLTLACDRYSSEMGWNGDGRYSKSWSEKPWHAAWPPALALLGAPPALRPTPRGSLARDALARLLSEPSSRPDDAALLRTAADELHRWAATHRYTTECPACRRPGLEHAHLVDHLEHCLAHPAVARLRAAQAELGVTPPMAIDRFSPRHWKDQPAYLHDAQLKALDRLVELEPSELTTDERRDLETLVTDWEQLHVIAAERCPWCDLPADLEHLLRCESHPAAVASRALRPTKRTFRSRLRAEADRYAVALAYLVAACGSFWNGMTDGERGKSVSNDANDAMSDRARKFAATAINGSAR